MSRLKAGIAGCVIGIALLAPAYASAGTITVNSNADNVTDDGLCTFREAIQAANGNAAVNAGGVGGDDCPDPGPIDSDDTINLPGGTITLAVAGSGENVSATGDLDVQVQEGVHGDLDIQGLGTTVNASDLDRPLDVFGNGKLTASELTLTNGTTPGVEDGGGIRASATGLDMLLTGVDVTNNVNFNQGGGIIFAGDTLDMLGSTVEGNSSTTGSVQPVGAGIRVGVNSTLNLGDSTISGNTAEKTGSTGASVSGGGIAGQNATIYMERTTVHDNHLDVTTPASADFPEGGGVFARNTNLTVIDSTISSNFVTGGNIASGGGVYYDDTDNTPNNVLRIFNSTLSGNAGLNAANQENGGALRFAGGVGTIAFSTFSLNTASDGEAIYATSPVTQTGDSLTLRANVFDEDGTDACEHPNNITPTTAGYNIDAGITCTNNPVGGAVGDQRNTSVNLGALADNGGGIRTHELLAGSNGIDDIPEADCTEPSSGDVDFDQRGFPRPLNGDANADLECDVGAYERVECNGQAVTILGTGSDQTIAGTAGDDVIDGLGGADTIRPGAGNDMVCGGDGSDTISYSDMTTSGLTTATLLQLPFGAATGAEAGSDTFTGMENLIGSPFDDGTAPPYLMGDSGANTINGLAGNDRMQGGGGDDTLIGGVNTTGLNTGDTASYEGAIDAPVTANLTTGTAQSASALAGGNDTLDDIENLIGGTMGDTLIGDSDNNALNGFNGNDSLEGRLGNDAFQGGIGTDTVSFAGVAQGVNASMASGSVTAIGQGNDPGGTGGTSGIENLTGSSEADTLSGDASANVLDGAGGNDVLGDGVTTTAFPDTFIGGAGADAVSYLSRNAADDNVTVDLTATTDNGGEATENDDVAADIEGAIGGSGADILVGDETANIFTGNNNEDTITGNGGLDAIDAGSGADNLFLQDDLSDTADCGADADPDTVAADGPAGTDVLTNCAEVGDVVDLDTPPVVDPPVTTPPPPAATATAKCPKGKKRVKVKRKGKKPKFKCVKKKKRKKR